MAIASRQDPFDGLIRPGESIDAALRRLERRPDYTQLLGTDAGQRLLEEAARVANARRRGLSEDELMRGYGIRKEAG